MPRHITIEVDKKKKPGGILFIQMYWVVFAIWGTLFMQMHWVVFACVMSFINHFILWYDYSNKNISHRTQDEA